MSFLRSALVARVLIASALVAGSVAAARAHVVAQPNTAVAGASFTAGFLVAHGCDGSPTIALRIKVPEEVTAVRPLPKDGWTVTEVAGEIAWRGGSLPAKSHEVFGIALKLPATPGKTLYFQAIQECEQGTNRWIEIPAAGQTPKDLHNPAPFITLTPLP
jgi:uncharacterized protein YcnI